MQYIHEYKDFCFIWQTIIFLVQLKEYAETAGAMLVKYGEYLIYPYFFFISQTRNNLGSLTRYQLFDRCTFIDRQGR